MDIYLFGALVEHDGCRSINAITFLRFLADGTTSGATHRNECRYSVVNGHLYLRNHRGHCTTHFTELTEINGWPALVGAYMGSSARHVLVPVTTVRGESTDLAALRGLFDNRPWPFLGDMMPDRQAFLDFFQDRTVAVVGPASTLKGTGFGARIDSCDITVYLHDSVPRIAFKDYGSRCDVVYRLCHHFYKTEVHLPWRETPPKLMVAFSSYHPHDKVAVNNNVGWWRKHGVPGVRTGGFHEWYRRTHGSTATTGIIAIGEILSAAPKSVLVAGFSLYHTGYNTDLSKTHGRPVVRQYDHCFRNDRIWLQAQHRSDPRLLLDDYLTANINDPSFTDDFHP